MNKHASRQLQSLNARHNDMTSQLILDSAIALLQTAPVNDLTVRAIARQGNLSERTIFRYFPSRDELLDHVAAEAAARLDMPEPPATLDELLAAPRALYGAFEAKMSLTRALLHSELFPRMRVGMAERRWKAISRLVDQCAPEAAAASRQIAAANIRYHLAATTWHYYRFYFSFSFEDSVACAETTIRQSLQGVQVQL